MNLALPKQSDFDPKWMSIRDPSPEDGARLFDELMRFLPDGMTANAWAVRAGVSRAIWTDLKRHGNPSRRTLEKLLAAAGSSLAEFEALRVGQPASSHDAGKGVLAESDRGWRGAAIAPVPLFAARVAGEFGKAGSGIELYSIDRFSAAGKIDRPMALAADPDAYAVAVAGETMWPRYRAGRRLLVSPGAPVAVGDDVLVQLDSGKLLIKELVRRTPSKIELRQFNPDVTFTVRNAAVATIQKVVGEAL